MVGGAGFSPVPGGPNRALISNAFTLFEMASAPVGKLIEPAEGVPEPAEGVPEPVEGVPVPVEGKGQNNPDRIWWL